LPLSGVRSLPTGRQVNQLNYMPGHPNQKENLIIQP